MMFPPFPTEELQTCQQILHYTFADVHLLEQALTHASFASAIELCNERLEFLGDAVLALIIAEHLFRSFPQGDEGKLTTIKSAVVSRVAQASCLTRLCLRPFLRVSQSIGEKPPASVLANIFEAILGAVYLDGGLSAARSFALEHLHEEMQQAVGNPCRPNYKVLLQELSQGSLALLPTYSYSLVGGHVKRFSVCVAIQERRLAIGWGSSKKEAEETASFAALSALAREIKSVPTALQHRLAQALEDVLPPGGTSLSTPIPENLLHPKAILQYLTQKYGFPQPEYRLLDEKGPAHHKQYTMEVCLDSQKIAEATAFSKKEAQELAAQEALAILERGGKWKI